MVLKQHKALWDQVFKIPGFFATSFLMFGFQEMNYANQSNFKKYLESKGVKEITVMDWDDKRADVHLDMNFPMPFPLSSKRFKVVADIGCLEHVLNTKQTLENCLNAVEVGGLYLLHTPVMGYFKHGIHTFNPDLLRLVLLSNGFTILLDKYSTKQGVEIKKPVGDTLVWIVAKRITKTDEFIIPIDNHGAFEVESRK